MKLIYCPICGDVFGLLGQMWRICVCGHSGGQYNRDQMTATVGGEARVLGIGNPFFNDLFPFLEEKGKRAMRQKFYGQPDTDCWWGDFAGERQLFHIASPKGPRVKVEVLAATKLMNKVVIKDKREIWIDGKKDIKEVLVPANFDVRLRQLIKGMK